MKKMLFALILLTTTSGFALVSPLNQSIREIEKILSSRELAQYFHQNDTIVEIRHEGDNYIVRTEDSQITIEVIYIPTQRVGPKDFKLIFRPAK